MKHEAIYFGTGIQKAEKSVNLVSSTMLRKFVVSYMQLKLCGVHISTCNRIVNESREPMYKWNAKVECLWMEQCFPDDYNDLLLDSVVASADEDYEDLEICL